MNVPSLSRLDRFNKQGPVLSHARVTSEFTAAPFLRIMQLFVMKAPANLSLKRLCQGHFDHMCLYSYEVT